MMRYPYTGFMARYPKVALAIRKLFAEATRHDWSLEALRHELAAQGVSADRSSVSRALTALVGAGQARRLVVRGSLRFEDASGHHDHLSCERCGHIEEISCSVLNVQATDIAKEKGFRLLAHELVLNGICPNCLQEESTATSTTGASTVDEVVSS